MASREMKVRALWGRVVVLLSGVVLAHCQAGSLSEGTPKAEERWEPLADHDATEAQRRLIDYASLIRDRGYSYIVGDNPAIHRDITELTGLTAMPEGMPLPKPVDFEGEAPERYDGRAAGIGLPPVRDQGQCGSCWAFSTMGALEAAIARSDSEHVDLSEQWLVDCNGQGYGCGGGYMAFDQLLNPGAVMEGDYPYRAYDASCQAGGLGHPYRIRNYGRTSGDLNSIKAAIYYYGAVSVAMNACGSIPGYTGGIYDSTECNSGEQNHAVLLVGWDDTVEHRMGRGVWIMRNSWGPGWGEGGYMRIAYGAARIAEEAWYVEYGTQPEPDPDPQPDPDPGTPPTPQCSDTCFYRADGICDDGGPGSQYHACELGTDCSDCGPRADISPVPDPGPDPDPVPDPTPDPVPPDSGACDNSCPYAYDGQCDDCGPGALYCLCMPGTDCADCGPRSGDDGGCPSDGGGCPSDGGGCDWGSGPGSYNLCDDSCAWASDGSCDDGGPGAYYAICPIGTDCADCGARALY